MLKPGRRLVQRLTEEGRFGEFVRHGVIPSFVDDREKRRPIFVMSTASAGSTWIGAMLGHARSHVFIHEVKIRGGKSGRPLDWFAANAPWLVPGRALFVLFEAFERGRLWTLASHAKTSFKVKRPELLMPFNLGPFDLEAPEKTHRLVDVVDTAGGHVAIAPLLRRAYPNAVLCFILRDPRDVVLSIKYRKRFGHKTSLEGWAQAYVDTLGHLDRFKESSGIDVMRYEDWKADAHGQLTAFVARHRLPMSAAEIEEAVMQHDEKRMRSGETQRVGNLSDKASRGWKEELTSADKASIKPILDPILISTGYESSTAW